MSSKRKRKPKFKHAKLVTSVYVPEEMKTRRVFYVRREILFDERGRVCHTPLELGMMLATAIERRDADFVAGVCWDALNFVHNGKVPRNWIGVYRKAGPTPLAI